MFDMCTASLQMILVSPVFKSRKISTPAQVHIACGGQLSCEYTKGHIILLKDQSLFRPKF